MDQQLQLLAFNYHFLRIVIIFLWAKFCSSMKWIFSNIKMINSLTVKQSQIEVRIFKTFECANSINRAYLKKSKNNNIMQCIFVWLLAEYRALNLQEYVPLLSIMLCGSENLLYRRLSCDVHDYSMLFHTSLC